MGLLGKREDEVGTFRKGMEKPRHLRFHDFADIRLHVYFRAVEEFFLLSF